VIDGRNKILSWMLKNNVSQIVIREFELDEVITNKGYDIADIPASVYSQLS
jgi:hypothetical protein